MNGMPNESDRRMVPKDEIDSTSIEEDSSGGSLNGGNQVLKKGPWTSAEDAILIDYVKKHGEGNWNAVQKHTGLSRCGKSCRLRWANHLRPNLKKGAFTPEEEQLIIELHAKMGNKWARMAAHLPGRTDNEIKNYWNTRIKRRQRAGLPLYPPNINFQVSDENQQSKNVNEYSYSDKQPNELMQGSNFDIPDITFENFNANYGSLSYAPPFPDIAASNMLNQRIGSLHYPFTNPMSCVKRLRDSENLIRDLHGTDSDGLSTYEHFLFKPSGKIKQTFGLGYPYDPDPNGESLTPLESAVPGSHALLNGTFSASSPIDGTVKLELPSLQYTETDGNSWLACSSTPLEAADTYIESPPTTVSLQSECISPRNSGLLEALLHEAQTLGSAKKKPSDKSSSSTVTPGNVAECSGVSISEKLEEYNDPISPLGRSASSVFNEYTPPISGSSLDEFPHSMAPSISAASDNILVTAEHVSSPNVVDKGISPCRPDALLGSVWLDDGSQSAKDQSVFNDAIAILLGQDLCNEYKHLPSEPPSMLVQGFGLDSDPWNNMPSACQMP
ncbi:unnamed protein product [Musa acuminata subsp. burmannicoides]